MQPDDRVEAGRGQRAGEIDFVSRREIVQACHLRIRVIAERVLARRELPGNHAEHEDVRARIRFLVGEGFRRHIAWRARDDSRLRQPRAGEPTG